MKIKANAKINIGLQVLRKRDDGFHDINTIFIPVCISDEIFIEPSEKLELTCIPDLDLPNEENLVYKAAVNLRKNIKSEHKGAKITLLKKLPDGGGLGGGSSDAAAVLKGLNEFWNAGLSCQELFNIALELGSDVPFFLKEGAAVGTGRGEILNYFDFKLPYHLLLVFPGIHIPTPQSYKALDRENKNYPVTDFRKILTDNIDDPEYLKKHIINDFEPNAFRLHPELKKIKEELYNQGAEFALMSGSGSTMYGLFREFCLCQAAADSFRYKSALCPAGDDFSCGS